MGAGGRGQWAHGRAPMGTSALSTASSEGGWRGRRGRSPAIRRPRRLPGNRSRNGVSCSLTEAHARPGWTEGLPTAGQARATQAAFPSRRQWNARQDKLVGKTDSDIRTAAGPPGNRTPRGRAQNGVAGRGAVSPSNQGGWHLCPAATASSRPGPAGWALPPGTGWGTRPRTSCSCPGLVHLPGA